MCLKKPKNFLITLFKKLKIFIAWHSLLYLVLRVLEENTSRQLQQAVKVLGFFFFHEQISSISSVQASQSTHTHKHQRKLQTYYGKPTFILSTDSYSSILSHRRTSNIDKPTPISCLHNCGLQYTCSSQSLPISARSWLSKVLCHVYIIITHTSSSSVLFILFDCQVHRDS